MNLQDEYSTPQMFFAILDNEFHFDVDVCASKENAKCPVYITKEQDALAKDWREYYCHFRGRSDVLPTCWMNPPYSDPKPWVKKAFEESQQGVTVVALLPGDFSTNWWHDYVIKACKLRLLKGRLKFSGQSAARWANAVAVFKPHTMACYHEQTGPEVIWWDWKK